MEILVGVCRRTGHVVRVLHSDVPPDVARARLRFYRAAQVTFQRVLTLLGMTAPDHLVPRIHQARTIDQRDRAGLACTIDDEPERVRRCG